MESRAIWVPVPVKILVPSDSVATACYCLNETGFASKRHWLVLLDNVFLLARFKAARFKSSGETHFGGDFEGLGDEGTFGNPASTAGSSTGINTGMDMGEMSPGPRG